MAALAAAGQGQDAAKPVDRERSRLRQQALVWLRADLASWSRQLESGQPKARATVPRALRPWQRDKELASIRDAAALAKLPAEEQEACRKFWAEVGATLKRASGQE